MTSTAHRFAVDHSDPAHPTVHTTGYIGGWPEPLTFKAAQQAVIRTMQARKAGARAEIDRVKAIQQRTAFPGHSGYVFGIRWNGSEPPELTTVDQLWGNDGSDGLTFTDAKAEIISHHRHLVEHADAVCRAVRALTARGVIEQERQELAYTEQLTGEVQAHAEGRL
jgi:hypothetical protein